MGRYNFAAQRVHSHATAMLRNPITQNQANAQQGQPRPQSNPAASPPSWYTPVSQTPPSARLVRPALQRSQKPGKKTSRLFKPLKVNYEEDQLRWEYFNDHPWELARPRVILEEDGRDHEKWNWGVELDVSMNRPKNEEKDEHGRTASSWDRLFTSQAGRPLNGESVIQRQSWLLNHTPLTRAAAYDKARKELYRVRHYRETETRVAREEALSTGAFFGAGPNEVGSMLEDKAYENWRGWAEKEIAAIKQAQGAAYTGTDNEEAAIEIKSGEEEELQEVSAEIPASEAGQTAQGGAAVHP